ncbi:alpha-L-arabinofuranosidase [Amycolatopsis decaplanina DSM 44594]|uniref:Alpha-L-arabinofuranosidase n=1 Tax=Amycolatopsis decaplanina DSM 44594 TaxID=1284240 RepID=M2Y2P9_9PSEU|nr:alpha-L-arabinofuranosidase [Amycolatopsis decaplanina DSM 44594]
MFFTGSASANAISSPASVEKTAVVHKAKQVGFMLSSNLNNRCLEVRAANSLNGALVTMWDCHGGSNERWFWDGEWIRSDQTGKCLDIVAGNTGDAASVDMFDCHSDWLGQKWYWDGNLLKSRIDPGGNRCLAIVEANRLNGAGVEIFGCSRENPNYQWRTT